MRPEFVLACRSREALTRSVGVSGRNPRHPHGASHVRRSALQPSHRYGKGAGCACGGPGGADGRSWVAGGGGVAVLAHDGHGVLEAHGGQEPTADVPWVVDGHGLVLSTGELNADELVGPEGHAELATQLAPVGTSLSCVHGLTNLRATSNRRDELTLGASVALGLGVRSYPKHGRQ
ncbi:MAG: hypothetical protein CMB99_01155 [Flavobacteriaceae bacterium]|nr:hypothetical protein [Flavobacteriaceae bacterium]